jgi:hypothetical protein
MCGERTGEIVFVINEIKNSYKATESMPKQRIAAIERR